MTVPGPPSQRGVGGTWYWVGNPPGWSWVADVPVPVVVVRAARWPWVVVVVGTLALWVALAAVNAHEGVPMPKSATAGRIPTSELSDSELGLMDSARRSGFAYSEQDERNLLSLSHRFCISLEAGLPYRHLVDISVGHAGFPNPIDEGFVRSAIGALCPAQEWRIR